MVNAIGEGTMGDTRVESDSLGRVAVAADKLWGAQTQRSLEHFSIGRDLMPREMISAYAILKRAAAVANHAGGRLETSAFQLITHVCDEIIAGNHHDMFPVHVWMTGSGTQFNMNVNEVISNRCCQLAGTQLGGWLYEFPKVPGRRHAAQPQEDRRVSATLTHARDGVEPSDRLRQGGSDCSRCPP